MTLLRHHHPPPAPVYKAPHITQQKTSNWDPLIDPLNEQPRKIEDKQDFAQRSQFPKLEIIKEEMRQEMKIWQKSILMFKANAAQTRGTNTTAKTETASTPSTVSPPYHLFSRPHPNAMLYNIPPQS